MTPDDLFEWLVSPCAHLDPSASQLFMAKLILLLCQEIKDPAIIAAAINEARKDTSTHEGHVASD